MEFEDILLIPPGINFECTGCGNCCLMWPVPTTQADHDRIQDLLKPQDIETVFKSRDLKTSTKDKLSQFPFTLEKKVDGRCTFLTEELRCDLQEKFGEDAKPSMCQLFPYTFTEAPDGFYASLSFASTGVLFNSGRALTEQTDFLKTRLRLFKKSFPDLNLDWSNTQLYDGHPLKWVDYLLIEKNLLKHFEILENSKQNLEEGSGKSQEESGTDNNGTSTSPILKRLRNASLELVGAVSPDIDLDQENLIEAPAPQADLILIRHLLDYYLPADPFASRRDAFGAHVFKQHLVLPPNIVQMLISNETSLPLAQICRLELGALDQESENLLARFVYCRIFGKLYFGAGFAHLSVISGMHHLGLLVALLRIRLKFLHFYNAHKVGMNINDIPTVMPPIEFNELAELVRALERRLSSLQYSKEVSTSLQVLLESPKRFARIMELAK